MSGSQNGAGPVFLGLLRIISAFLFMAHGTQKLFDFPIPAGRPVETFSLGWTAGVLELVGGALLMVGLFSRPVAFILSGLMAVGYWMAHGTNSFWPIQNGGELAALYCFVFLYISVAGGGALSVDAASAKNQKGL